MAQETNEYRENRLASLRALADLGFTPYGHAFPHTDLKVIPGLLITVLHIRT